jgi:hypothetical protein
MSYCQSCADLQREVERLTARLAAVEQELRERQRPLIRRVLFKRADGHFDNLQVVEVQVDGTVLVDHAVEQASPATDDADLVALLKQLWSWCASGKSGYGMASDAAKAIEGLRIREAAARHALRTQTPAPDPETGLAACPFCGNAESSGEQHDLRRHPLTKFIASCHVCGARTRQCDTPEEAAALWNERRAALARPDAGEDGGSFDDEAWAVGREATYWRRRYERLVSARAGKDVA